MAGWCSVPPALGRARRRCKCYPVTSDEWPTDPDIVERAPIRSCIRRGAAIDLTLDRGRESRSQLMFTTARGRDAVFWQSPRTRKPARPNVSPHGDAMSLLFGPLTGGRGRRLQLVKAMLLNPRRWLNPLRPRGWSQRSVVFTVMQSRDVSLSLRPRGKRSRLATRITDGSAPTSYLPIANRAAEIAAKHVDGYPQTSLIESLGNAPNTAHILGGAVIAESPARGVVDRHRRAFGYQNLLITDGSTIPANVGVNPSLTITAMAEEALSHVPEKT